MRTTRIHVSLPAGLAPGDHFELPAEPAHHLVTVLRHRSGDPVRLFDGHGSEWLGTLETAGRKRCQVVLAEALPVIDPPMAVGIGMAILKGDALDRAVQKCVELGVTSIELLDTDHVSIRREQRNDPRRQAHLGRIVVAASEQSGARFIAQVRGPSTLAGLLETLPTGTGRQVLALDAAGSPLPLTLPRLPTTLLSGPEGGWSASERTLFERHGVPLYHLGSQVLRAETAPLVALAALRHGWGWMD